MSRIPYSYCAVKYVHDPAVGEVLNIGVLMCAPSEQFFAIKLEPRFERLSEAFAGFNGDLYRSLVRTLQVRVERLANSATNSLFALGDSFEHVLGLSNLAVPDKGLSLQFGSPLAGIAYDLNDEIEHLFERLVSSQYARKKRDHRSDEDVWQHFSRPLARKRLTEVLTSKTFVTPDYELKFDHAFKNGRWHVLEPVTMDYSRVQRIQEKAARILGDAVILDGNSEIDTLYLLLGKPELETHKAAYVKAKNLLHKIPVKNEIIDEDEAEDFANELAAYMKEHGVTTKSSVDTER
jgi:hypothetical protein